ncbi:MAG TPA: AraC family transcriptional regulator [Kofleriaceae bacterium]|nr:AraC family transcriptional regulator [Kofleriaceae bacterium]
MPSVVIPQIGIQAIRPLFDALRIRGIDATALLGEVGLGELDATDPDARFPLVCLDKLWDRAAARVGDPDLGLHVAESIDPSSFGLLSYLGTASATWGDGLHRLLRYFRLLSEGSRYALTVHDGVATLTASQDTPFSAPVRQRVEFTISVLFCYARHLITGDWQVLDVFFEHAAPLDLAEHRRVYGRVPRFATWHSGFSFDGELLARPLRTGNPTLAELLERLAAHMLADLPPVATIAGTLRELCLRDGFEHELTLETAAHRLHLSPRTLQRRLRDEGTSHQEVVDDSRRQLASRMLVQSGLGIAEVAFALGFSEPSGLHRAFKRWTGMTPAEYRRAARSACLEGDHPASTRAQ